MAATTAEKVADYIIRSAHDSGALITNLKLQKLVYYAQAWHLALFDEPLFDDPIEAWVHGPVVPSIYSKFRNFGWNPIGLDTDEVDLPEDLQEHIDEVIEVYGGFSGWDLERLTHSEEPWRKARGDLPPDEPSSDEISHEDMKEYYRTKLDEQEETEEN
ncbi:MAG: DUF4065 domain-containing protein [bacterium]|nr:DUF4065 domain-containing protein [bacterium]